MTRKLHFGVNYLFKVMDMKKGGERRKKEVFEEKWASELKTDPQFQGLFLTYEYFMTG